MKPDLSTIKALVFDAYGTLLDVKSLDERLNHHYGNKAEAINSLWRQKQLQYTWLRSLMDQYQPFSQVTRQALEFACEENDAELRSDVLSDLLEHYEILRCFPEVPNLLEELSQYFRCAILSNADLPMLTKACDHNEIMTSLEAVLSADAVQVNKPAPAVYELATDHFQCDKDEIAFISSNTWDVAGAKSFGLRCIWLKRTNTMDKLNFAPDYLIKGLHELIP